MFQTHVEHINYIAGRSRLPQDSLLAWVKYYLHRSENKLTYSGEGTGERDRDRVGWRGLWRERYRQTERKRQGQNSKSNSKTLFYKDCSFGLVKNLSDKVVLPKLLMSKYKMTGIKLQREREREREEGGGGGGAQNMCICNVLNSSTLG